MKHYIACPLWVIAAELATNRVAVIGFTIFAVLDGIAAVIENV